MAEDEPSIARLVREHLSRHGYHVTCFPDPRKALDYFRERPDEVDLLLTDLSMPEMLGDDLGGKLREIRPGFPILIMTGFGGFLDLASLQRGGPASVLLKPFSGGGLLQAVEGVLQEAAGRRASSS